MAKGKDEVISSRVDPEFYQAVKRMGVTLDRSIGWIVRKAVEEFLERQKRTGK